MSETQPTPEQPRPKFNANLGHHVRPKVRPLRAFPINAQKPNGETGQLLGLADAKQVSPRMVATLPAATAIVPLLDGEHRLDEIVSTVGRGLTLDFLKDFIAQLDDAGLLEGPTFEKMKAKMREDFDASDILPPSSTADVADALAMRALVEEGMKQAEITPEQKAQRGPDLLREHFDKWIAEALKDEESPSLDTLPKALVAPHVDYGRGWMNYSQVWGRMKGVERPDRVIILGTNHFGDGTGVTACDKGYRTPLGDSPLAADALQALKDAIGPDLAEKMLTNRFDHEREHSIELQVPWIQHIFGPDANGGYVPVLGVLVHDPAQNNGESYDGSGVAMAPFIDALTKVVDALPGKTLIVSSADLSHVGPAFGDQQRLIGQNEEEQQAAEQFRNQVVQTDQEMLKMVVENRPDELVGAMAWRQNPTRWCSTGNIVAALSVAKPTEVRLLKYGAAIDNQGVTMVSNAALVMY